MEKQRFINIGRTALLKTSKMKKEEIKMPLDALKLIAESWGFELVEKEREIKVGDFGKFWDNGIETYIFDFVKEKKENGFIDGFHVQCWDNFAHLTDEEKQQIQENW
jgi:hypothetical protein